MGNTIKHHHLVEICKEVFDLKSELMDTSHITVLMMPDATLISRPTCSRPLTGNLSAGE